MSVPRRNFAYDAVCVRVIDGDTLIAKVDCGYNVFVNVTVRVRGVDTPEIRGTEREAGLRSLAFVTDLVADQSLRIQSFKDRQSFARWVCDVWVLDDRGRADPLLLSEAIIAAGFGEPFMEG